MSGAFFSLPEFMGLESLFGKIVCVAKKKCAYFLLGHHPLRRLFEPA